MKYEGNPVFKLVSEGISSGNSSYQILGFSKFTILSSEIAKLRTELNPSLPNPLSTSILKYLDDQTVIALQCTHQATKEIKNLANWGVIVSPKHPGRKRVSGAFDKFKLESAWGISPHLVPYDSLHSPSGIVSLAYQMNGINLGAGGFAGMEGQGLLAGFTSLENNFAEGLVLIWTGYQEEFSLYHLESNNNQIIEGYALAIIKQKKTNSNKSPYPGLNISWNKNAKNTAFVTPLSLENLFKIPDNFQTDYTFQIAINVLADFIPASI